MDNRLARKKIRDSTNPNSHFDQVSARSKLLQHPVLTEDVFLDLMNRAKSGEVNATNDLIRNNIRLVASVILHAPSMMAIGRSRGLDFDDLLSFGIDGLYKAIKYFKSEKGFKFSTYATHIIKQKIWAGIMKNEAVLQSLDEEIGNTGKKIGDNIGYGSENSTIELLDVKEKMSRLKGLVETERITEIDARIYVYVLSGYDVYEIREAITEPTPESIGPRLIIETVTRVQRLIDSSENNNESTDSSRESIVSRNCDRTLLLETYGVNIDKRLSIVGHFSYENLELRLKLFKENGVIGFVELRYVKPQIEKLKNFVIPRLRLLKTISEGTVEQIIEEYRKISPDKLELDKLVSEINKILEMLSDQSHHPKKTTELFGLSVSFLEKRDRRHREELKNRILERKIELDRYVDGVLTI
ncbi:MAG: sigma factor [Candidatus Micrarchaeota archaeon]|nr:sigma factor [Candidatus Micrarchaeota archaeon]